MGTTDLGRRFRPAVVLALLTPTGLAAAPADVPADWWAGVQQQIADSEYEVTWQAERPQGVTACLTQQVAVCP